MSSCMAKVQAFSETGGELALMDSTGDDWDKELKQVVVHHCLHSQGKVLRTGLASTLLLALSCLEVIISQRFGRAKFCAAVQEFGGAPGLTNEHMCVDCIKGEMERLRTKFYNTNERERMIEAYKNSDPKELEYNGVGYHASRAWLTAWARVCVCLCGGGDSKSHALWPHFLSSICVLLHYLHIFVEELHCASCVGQGVFDSEGVV